MGHRRLFTSSPMFESEQDQNWNHMQTDQTYGNIISGAVNAENSQFFYPIENIFSDGIHFSPHWNPLPRSTGYSSSSQNADVAPYQPDVSGPSHDPFQQHTASSVTFSVVPENYASSSSYDRQAFQGSEASFVDLTMGNERGIHKRKSPGVPLVFERGSTSRCYGAGSSSSEIPTPSDLCPEKVGIDPQPMAWDRVAMNPGYNRGNGLSIRAEESMRNVRSRSTRDLAESHLARSHLLSSNLPPQSTFAANPTPMDISVQPPPPPPQPPQPGLTLEWNHFGMPSNGNVLASDNSAFGYDPSRFLLGNSSGGGEGFNHDFMQSTTTTRNAVPQSYPGPTAIAAHSARGVRSGNGSGGSYSQRPNPSSRASSSSSSSGLRLGHPSGPADEVVSESHSRLNRPLSFAGWRNGDRIGSRSRAPHDRYRLHFDDASRDRIISEGLMAVDRSALYGSRSGLDQHREMRLDVDNMSYEELLALGERIGSVSTGVSTNLMSKCITETIYCSSDQMHDEESCAICLEEYKNMDDVGTLKSCGHDYHVECIKKWLEMKNLCPICKRPALPEKLKGK